MDITLLKQVILKAKFILHRKGKPETETDFNRTGFNHKETQAALIFCINSPKKD